MKKLFLILTLVSGLYFGNAQIQGYNLNDTVADFTVTDIEGNTHSLYDYTSQGKYVYLDFFFVDCGPCQSTVHYFNEFFDKYGCGAGDVMCMSIDAGGDDDEDVEAFEETYGGSTNHAIAISADGGSGAVDNVFNPAAYPTYCLISPDNKIIELDIWPIGGVETFEATFPSGFSPEEMECTTTGTEDVTNLDFEVYPNPLTGKILNIKLQDQAEIEITSILGNTVYRAQVNGDTQIDLGSLSAGTYFVKALTPEASGIKKLVIR